MNPKWIHFLADMTKPHRISAGSTILMAPADAAALRSTPAGLVNTVDLTPNPVGYAVAHVFSAKPLAQVPQSTAGYVPCGLCAVRGPHLTMTVCEVCGGEGRVLEPYIRWVKKAGAGR